MQRTPGIEAGSTARASIRTCEVLFDGHLEAAFPAQHGFDLARLVLRPDLGRVPSELLVAADAGVVGTTALVLDGDYVAVGVPVRTLCGRRQ